MIQQPDSTLPRSNVQRGRGASAPAQQQARHNRASQPRRRRAQPATSHRQPAARRQPLTATDELIATDNAKVGQVGQRCCVALCSVMVPSLASLLLRCDIVKRCCNGCAEPQTQPVDQGRCHPMSAYL